MQLLLIEKDENNEKDKEYMDFYELNKKLSDMMNSYKNLTEEEKKVLKTEMEEIYKKQAEEGYIRKYFYRGNNVGMIIFTKVNTYKVTLFSFSTC